MLIQTILNGVIIVALLVWVGYRQTMWRPVSIPQMWRMPALFAVIGVVSLVSQKQVASFTVFDMSLVVVELILSLGVGAWMGALAHFRPLEKPVQLGRDGRYTAVVESRTGVFGLVLWIIVIVIRVGIDIFASHAGSHLAGATGLIFLIFAANRAARTWVYASRLGSSASLRA